MIHSVRITSTRRSFSGATDGYKVTRAIVMPRRVDVTHMVEAVGVDSTFNVTADETVSALKVVSTRPNGRVGLASKTDVANAEVLGIAVTGGNATDTVTVRSSGVLEDGAWSWVAGSDVFVSTNGNMTQSPTPLTAGEYLFKVGTAQTATTIAISLQFIAEG